MLMKSDSGYLVFPGFLDPRVNFGHVLNCSATVQHRPTHTDFTVGFPFEMKERWRSQVWAGNSAEFLKEKIAACFFN